MIVIPMAGVSRRFAEAGYDQPKYMLDLHGRSLFSRAVGSFSKLFRSNPFLFIARDDRHARAFIDEEVRALGISHYDVVMLDAPTRGQAETVRLGLEAAAVGDEEPLTIFNIDTIRLRLDAASSPSPGEYDGWLEVMRADDPGFSYAKVDSDGGHRVVETAEKRVISDLASTGLYHFERSGAYLHALACELASPTAPELYIAPLYNHLISSGGDVRVREVPVDDVIFCGVPAQYEALLSRPDVFDEAR